jgi:hypothetical protein
MELDEMYAVGWCCLDCYWKGTVGEMFPGPTAISPFACPKCRGSNTTKANNESKTLTEYHGEIGTKN